jgi:hypothetical protein
MSLVVRFVALAGLLALGACASVTPTATNARDWLVQYRTGNGLTPVSIDGRLAAFAQAQADAMAASNTLSHDVGGSFASRVQAAGLADAKIAENVAYGAGTEKAVMEQWKNSPAHDANLLMRGATRFGIASARSGGPKPRTYWAMAIAADPPPPVATMVTQGPVVRRVLRPSGESSVAGSLAAPFVALFGL